MIDMLEELRRMQSKDNNETFNPATDSLEAIRDAINSYQGLAFFGYVDAVPGANQFTINDLAGFGNTFYDNFWAIPIWNTGGAAAAPQGEYQPITGYISATGTFTTPAYSAAIAFGDAILIIHNSIVASLYSSGEVIFNDTEGVAGTIPPIGTPIRPVSDESNALTIAELFNLRKIRVYSTVAGGFIVPDTMEGYEFIGHGQYSGSDTISLNGRDVDGSVFRNLNITGAQGGTGLNTFEDCSLVDPTNLMGSFFRCLIQQCTIANGTTDMIDCVGWQGQAIIIADAPNPLNIFRWSGDLQIQSVTGGVINIYANDANIVIAASCTGGIFNIYGNGRVVNITGGAAVNDYTVLKQASVEDTYSLPDGVAENTVFTIAPGRQIKVTTIFLNLKNLTQAATIRIKVYNDGAYVTLETFNWNNLMDDGCYYRDLSIDTNVQVSIQSSIGEGAARDIPYKYFTEE